MSLYVPRVIDATGPDAQGNYLITLADGVSTRKVPGAIFEALYEPCLPPVVEEVPPSTGDGPADHGFRSPPGP